MNVFTVYYTVHKKPYTDNSRSSVVLAENKESVRNVLEKYYEIENKYQLKIGWIKEHDNTKEQMISLKTR